MIIDLILDRRDGGFYTAERFYHDVMAYGEIGHGIARALDSGTNKDVKRELCAYIDAQEYNPEIKEYINLITWLKEE